MGVSLKRLESLALRELSALLRRDDSNRGLSGVGVTEVRITNDLSYMTIYYTFYMGKKENYDALLQKNKGYIRHELAKKLKARKMPELIFKFDESLEYGNHINEVIHEMNERDQKIKEEAKEKGLIQDED